MIEDASQKPGSLNHLGVEVETAEAAAAAQNRLAAEGLATVEDEVPCCYAAQDKVWVGGPGGEPWEVYTVLSDTEVPEGEAESSAACCATRPDLAVTGVSSSSPSCC